jgi:hypothetical protein
MPQAAFYVCTFVFQVLTFAAIVVAVVALWLQRRALKQQWLGQREASCRTTIPALIQHLESPAVRAARDVLRDKLRNKPVGQWTDDEQAAASDLLAAFDLAGALARDNEPTKDLVLVHWSHEIVAVCRACRELIDVRRTHEGVSFLCSLLWLEAEAKRSLAEDFASTAIPILEMQANIDAKQPLSKARPEDSESKRRVAAKSSQQKRRRNRRSRAA